MTRHDVPLSRPRHEKGIMRRAGDVIEAPEAGHASVRERPAFCGEQFTRFLG